MEAKSRLPQFSSFDNPDVEIFIVRARIDEPTTFSGKFECLRHHETFNSAADAEFHHDLLGCDVFPVFVKAQIN